MKKTYITPSTRCKKVQNSFICTSISDITVVPTETTESMEAKQNGIFGTSFDYSDEE